MTLGDFVLVVRRHIVAAVVTFVIIVVAAIAFTALLPTTYTSSSRILASYVPQGPAEQNSSELNAGTSYVNAQIPTYLKLATSREVLNAVNAELGNGQSIQSLQDSITVTNLSGTQIIDMMWTGFCS